MYPNLAIINSSTVCHVFLKHRPLQSITMSSFDVRSVADEKINKSSTSFDRSANQLVLTSFVLLLLTAHIDLSYLNVLDSRKHFMHQRPLTVLSKTLCCTITHTW
jgi:hypothetical protein